jgi:hypothetical protein
MRGFRFIVEHHTRYRLFTYTSEESKASTKSQAKIANVSLVPFIEQFNLQL